MIGSVSGIDNGKTFDQILSGVNLTVLLPSGRRVLMNTIAGGTPQDIPNLNSQPRQNLEEQYHQQ